MMGHELFPYHIVIPPRSSCGEVCSISFVLLSFFLGTLILLTYAQSIHGRPTLKDVIELLFWHESLREPKESYMENKCALYEQICENHDMNYTDMNCFETKCQIRESKNCESHQEKSVLMPHSFPLSCSKIVCKARCI